MEHNKINQESGENTMLKKVVGVAGAAAVAVGAVVATQEGAKTPDNVTDAGHSYTMPETSNHDYTPAALSSYGYTDSVAAFPPNHVMTKEEQKCLDTILSVKEKLNTEFSEQLSIYGKGAIHFTMKPDSERKDWIAIDILFGDTTPEVAQNPSLRKSITVEVPHTVGSNFYSLKELLKAVVASEVGVKAPGILRT